MGLFGTRNELKCGGDRKLTGADLRSEGQQIGDDAAASNLAMMCGKYEELYCSGKCYGRGGASRDFGSWDTNGYKYCPTGMAICGLQTKVEQWRYDKYGTIDNTGLNRVIFYCCYLNPSNRPMESDCLMDGKEYDPWEQKCKKCIGGGSCCTKDNKCGVMEGDCDYDIDCEKGLKCGVDNCVLDPIGLWSLGTDCCYDPANSVCEGGDDCCNNEYPCGVGEGDCDYDSDCEEGLKCGTNNCKKCLGENLGVDCSKFQPDDDCCYKPE